MSKRFTDTDKWDRPWFRKLPTKYKLLWSYILDKCDAGGVWYVDMELASFMIGETFDFDDCLEFFSKQIEEVDLGARWFIKDFTEFQLGPLSEECKTHKTAIQVLKKHGLWSKVLKVPDRVLEGSGTLQDKEKEKEDSKSLEEPSFQKKSNTPAQPEKKLTDVQKIITVFKLCQGVPKEDKGWDRVFFARFSKPAKDLLEVLGNWRDAADCVQDVYEKLTSKGLTVTLETVVKHATEWKKDKSERSGGRVGILSV